MDTTNLVKGFNKESAMNILNETDNRVVIVKSGYPNMYIQIIESPSYDLDSMFISKENVIKEYKISEDEFNWIMGEQTWV